MTSVSSGYELSNLLARVENIKPVIESNREAMERDRHLADPVLQALLKEDLFKLLLPKEFGGFEALPTDALTVWEAVAKIDSAVGWNLSQASGGLAIVSHLAPAGADEVFGRHAQPIFAGAGFPLSSGIRVSNGYRVTGRMSFASGCRQADWLFFPMMIMEDGQPLLTATGAPEVRVALIPRDEVEVLDTWNTLGMRGTGSHDISVVEAFVPESLAVSLGGSGQVSVAAFDKPLYRLGGWTVISGESVVSIGIASAAIEAFLELASTRSNVYSKTPLQDKELIQGAVGRARSLVESARTYLHHALDEAFAELHAHRLLADESKISLQLANCHASTASVQAVDLIFEAAGSAAIRVEAPFERHLRDVRVIAAHTTKSFGRYASAGKMMFGMPADVPHLMS